MIAALALALALGQDRQGPVIPLRPPMDKVEEAKKFHSEPRRATPAAERMASYAARLKMAAESPFRGILWRNVGPTRQSGRVIDIDSPLDRPDQMLVAFATGGLWRTHNDGTSWEPIFDNQSSFGIGDFAVNRSGETIWVGTGENNSQRTSYAGTGVYKSTDGGKSWANMGIHESHHIGRVLIHPKNEQVVYVAVLGHLYSPNPERGVYKTTDGGKTWQHVLAIDETTGVIDLDFDPRDPETLYACAWDRDRRAWNFREAGPGSAVYKTTNGGKAWNRLAGLPEGQHMGRTGIAISPSKPSVLYAFVDSQAPDPLAEELDEFTPSGRLTLNRFRRLTPELIAKIERRTMVQFLTGRLPQDMKPEQVLDDIAAGKMTMQDLEQAMLKRNPSVFEAPLREAEVWRSDDSGATWRNVTGPTGFHAGYGYYFGKIEVHPTNPDELYMLGIPMVRSRDGGKTWTEIAERHHSDHHALWIDPRNPRRMMNGNDGGVHLSLDGGETWRHLNNLSVGQFTTIAVDNKKPYNVYGGLQDNGTMRGPSTHRPERDAETQWTFLGGGDGSAVAVDPRNDGDIVYTASQFGGHSAQNQATSERWNARASGKQGDPPLRYNWISPLIISSHHPDVIYLGSQKLHRSFSQGREYHDISDDLTKNRENGDVPHSTLTTISESPFRFGLIYVGADDGSLKMTPDSGLTWTDIATPAPTKWVSRVVASKWDIDTVYASQNGYRDDDFRPYLWKSTDQGKTWSSIAGNLPLEPINVIREDPARKDMLWVGTDMGVYLSQDGGKTWEPFGGNLPHTPVHDLVIHPRDREIVIASHARSVWIAPVALAQDLTPEIRGKALHIWPVADLAKTERWGYDRRPEWNSAPPSEPKVTGNFWTSAAGPATLLVKDKDGKVVKETKFDALRGLNAFEFGVQVAAGDPDAKPVLDRPKTPEEALRDPHLARRPQYLAAGDYTLEIAVGGKTESVAWKLKG